MYTRLQKQLKDKMKENYCERKKKDKADLKETQKKKVLMHTTTTKRNFHAVRKFHTVHLNNLVQTKMYKRTRIGVVRLLCQYIFISALIQIHTAGQLITPPVCL